MSRFLDALLMWAAPFIPQRRASGPPAGPWADGDGICPPWIAYPGVAPGDFFWREAGEAYWGGVWLPFWLTATEAERAACLDRRGADTTWRQYLAALLQANEDEE